MTEIINIVSHINKISCKSKAVVNSFYNVWNERPLDVHEAEVVLANYFARTINTASRVCDVVKALLDPIMIIKDKVYAKAVVDNLANLQDELGNGADKRAHLVLLAEWINTLLTKLGSKNVPIEDHYHKFLLKETYDFNATQKNLYNDESLITVVGTSFAQEVFADFMMKQLYEGYIKNYRNLFSDKKEFEKTTLYFDVHVDGTEEKHAELITEIICILCKTESDIEKIIQSYNTFEHITEVFWQALFHKMNSNSNFLNNITKI